MTSERLSEAIGMIDEDIIAAADKSRTEVRRSRKPLWIGVCSTAACAALITAVALTDPASYISGEDIVDPEYSSTTSVTTTIPAEDESAGGIITSAETLDVTETSDGADICTEEDVIDTSTNDAPKQGGTGTYDAPAAAETGDVVDQVILDTNDAPEEPVGEIIHETEEVEETIPEDVEETVPVDLPVSYYPTETAKLLFGASYPAMARHPDLYDFSSKPYDETGDPLDTFEAAETADAAAETVDCVETCEDVIEEEVIAETDEAAEPKDHNEAWDMWYDDQKALDMSKGTADDLREFFTGSMQTYLTSAEGENNVYSPVNLYLSLAMLSVTSGGESREQVLELLNAENVNDLLEQANAIWKGIYNNDGKMTSIAANSLWLRNDLHYDSNTLNELSEKLYASSFLGEMGSEEYNVMFRRWLSEQTGGYLNDSVNAEVLSPDTVMALTSTLYFGAQWTRVFSDDDTMTDIFRTADGTEVICEFMNRNIHEEICYFGDGYTAIRLSCDGNTGMWLILPDEGITPEKIAAGTDVYDMIFSGQHYWDWEDQGCYDVTLSLPKFDISAETDLQQGMMALGVTDVFDPAKADFSPLTADTGSYLNKAEQTVRVSIDEEGCTAVSYVVMENLPTGGPVNREDLELIFDRPFMFIIENDEGLPLFGGIVNEP